MSKTINLTVGERIASIKLFDAFKGSIETLRALLDDVKQFSVQEEEWNQAKLVKTPNPDGSTKWEWDDTVVNKELTIDSATADYLKGEIKRKSDSGEITLADTALLTLEGKLNA